MLLDLSRDDSLSMSWRSCARGVALSRLYRTGRISVERGGGVGSPGDLDCSSSVLEWLQVKVLGSCTLIAWSVTDGRLIVSVLGDDLVLL